MRALINMKENKVIQTSLRIGIIMLLFIITMFSSTSGVYVDTDVQFEIDSPLETYTFAEPMDFSRIIIASTYIVFNTTGFNVTSATTIEIRIDDIANNIVYPAIVDEELVSFTLVNLPGATWFNISGFSPSLYYNVSKNAVFYNYYQANGTGSISIYDADPGASPYIISANGSSYTPVITTTGSATGITNNSAILYADLVYDGGEACDVWIEYGTTTSYGSNSSYNATKTTGGEFLYDFSWDIQNKALSSDPTDLTRVDSSAPAFLFQRFDCYGNINITYINYSLTKRYTGDAYNLQSIFVSYPDSVSYSETVISTDDLSTYTDVNWFIFKFNPPIQLVDIHESSYKKYGFEIYGDNAQHNDLDIYSSYNSDYEHGAYHNLAYGDRSYDLCFIINNGTSYQTNLSAGQLYHYRAVAKNTNTTAYGSDVAFLTLPNATASGSAKGTSNFTRMNISFTPGDGANFTIIERNTTAGDWERGDATEIYNGTGTYFVDTNLTRDTTYYYRLWSVANWTYNPTVWQYSSGSGFYLFNTTSSIDPPYNGSSTYNSSTHILNLTWSRGNFSDCEIVVKNNNTWASNPGDGWVRQNSTNTWFNVSETVSGYYTIWSYNATEKIYSLTGLNIPWGAIAMQCYDEGNHTGLTFDVLITNEDLETLYLQNLTNSYYVDLNDIPFGDDTIFYISSDNYESRTYYYDLSVNNFYNLTFYLPYATPSGGSSDPDYDPDNISYSALYLISIINEYESPVEDVRIHILRYINDTDTYEDVAILMSDANGQADVYLYSGTVYKVNLSKSGYTSRIEDWIPDVELRGKTFRLNSVASEPIEFTIFWDNISFTGTMDSGGNITISYSDNSLLTTNTQVYLYERYNETDTLMDSKSYGSVNSYSYTVLGCNNSRLHYASLFFNHSYDFSIDQPVIIYIQPTNRTFSPHSIANLESAFTSVFGENPLGWGNSIAFFVAIIILCSFAPFDIGAGIIGASLSFIGIELAFVLNPILLVVVPIGVAIGIFYMFANRQAEEYA